LKLRVTLHSCYVIRCVQPGCVLGLAGSHLRSTGRAATGFRPELDWAIFRNSPPGGGGHSKLRCVVRGRVTATPRMHKAGAVQTRVLHSDTTLPLMCASGRKSVESFGRPFHHRPLFVCTHFQAYPCRSVCKTALKIK